MKKNILLLLLLSCLPILSQPKEKQSNYFSIGLEYGSNKIVGATSQDWSIRQNPTDYHFRGIYNITDARTSHFYVGIKPTYNILDNRLIIATGLRLNSLTTDLQNPSSRRESSYFFLPYKFDDTSIHLVRMKHIEERTSYLGIPLEIKFVPIQWRWFGLYAKAGTELGMKISSNLTLDYFDRTMKEFESDIFPAPKQEVNRFYSNFYGSFGLRTSLSKYLDFNIEVIIPSLLTQKNIAIRQAETISGIQVSIQMPLQVRKNILTMF